MAVLAFTAAANQQPARRRDAGSLLAGTSGLEHLVPRSIVVTATQAETAYEDDVNKDLY